MRAARIGPTVWELDGPMPTEKRSKTEMATGVLLRRWWTSLSAGWCGDGPVGPESAGQRGGGTGLTVFSVRGAPTLTCKSRVTT